MPAKSHGMFGTPVYRAWNSMIGRCYRPRDISYKNYGARGIRVCNEWRKPENFLNWASRSGYEPGLMLDRIDSGKDYGPDNCRWATRTEQNNNRRNNRFVVFNGERMTVAQAEQAAGFRRGRLSQRIHAGWPESRWFE